MKKIISLLSLLLPFAAFAQSPVMDASTYTPVVGDSFVQYTLLDSLLPVGPSGASVTWDFTGIVGDASTRTINYIDIASTGSSSFPNAGYAATGISQTQGTVFYSSSSSLISEEGEASQLQEMVLSDVKKINQFPLNYQDIFSDNFSGQATNALSLITYRNGSISVEYDGYGTANFPGGQTVQNVFRIHITETTADSIDNPLFPIVTTTQVVRDIYYEQGVKAPLAEISQTTIITPGGPQSFNTGYSRILPNLVSRNHELEGAMGLRVYPNPASQRAMLSFSSKNEQAASLVVMDLSGRILSKQNCTLHAGKNEIAIDCTGFSKGMYLVQLSTAEGTASTRLELGN